MIMRGFVYVITNPLMQGYCKVGFSINDPSERAKTLNTGSPVDYIVEYEAFVDNPKKIEGAVHATLSFLNKEREWFECNADVCIKAIKASCSQHKSAIYFEKLESAKKQSEMTDLSSPAPKLTIETITVQQPTTEPTKEKIKNTFVAINTGNCQNVERLGIPELKACADNGNSHAQFELARRYDDGDGVRKNLKEMFKYYSLAAEQGREKAITRVGIAHATGRGLTEKSSYIERNLEAVKRLAITVQNGDQEASFWLANILSKWDYSDEREDHYLSKLADKAISKKERKECEKELSDITSMRDVLASAGLNIKSMDAYAREIMRTLVNANYMPALEFIADGNALNIFDEAVAWEKYTECLNILSNAGNHKYGAKLADNYYFGWNGVETNHEKAKQLVEKHMRISWNDFVKRNSGLS